MEVLINKAGDSVMDVSINKTVDSVMDIEVPSDQAAAAVCGPVEQDTLGKLSKYIKNYGNENSC